jgi:hypothetical protein
MNLQRSLFLTLPFVATSVLSQTPALPQIGRAPAPAAPSMSQKQADASVIPPGVVIPAQLSKSVDAKKAKPGDKLEARTTMDLLSHGQVVIPRDTKLLGHVTEAQPRSKESPESKVGIAFDRISLKDGRELSMHATVQAIGGALNGLRGAGNESALQGPGGMPSSGPPESRGNMGGSAGGSMRPSGSQYPSSSAPDTSPGAMPSDGSTGVALDSHSHGVVGLKGLSLSDSGQGSLITSNRNNVHLDGGTQLILRTE